MAGERAMVAGSPAACRDGGCRGLWQLCGGRGGVVEVEDDAWIEDAGRVEGAFDGLHGVDVGGGAGEVEPGFFGDAHAVFGANGTAEGGDEAKDGVVGFFVVRWEAEEVDVEVAVAGMAEEDRAGGRGGCGEV